MRRVIVKNKKIGVFANSGWNLANFRSELISRFADQGNEMHLIAPDSLEAVADLGKTHRVRLAPAGTSIGSEIKSIFAIRRLLKQLQLDYLFTYTIKPNLYGAIAAPARTQVICNVTGLGEVFSDGRSPLNWAAKSLYRVAMKRASLVFAQNLDDLEFLKSSKLVPAEKLRYIPGSGVNLSRFRAQVQDESGHQGPPRFLFIGRFRVDKGFNEFVAAAEQILDSGCKAQFSMIGVAEHGRRYSIPKERLEAIRKRGQIEILDYQPDVRPLIEQSDCVVLPSYREGAPRSLLEASSMGKPVIATDVPGCKQVLVDGETGFLCQVRDTDSLADAMQRICALSPLQRAQMGALGREFVEDRFSVERVVEIYEAAVEELSHGRTADAPTAVAGSVGFVSASRGKHEATGR